MPAIYRVLHMVRSSLTPFKSIFTPSLVTFPFGLYFYNAQFVRMEATKNAIGDTTWNDLWLKWTYHPSRRQTKSVVVQPSVLYCQEMSRTTTIHSSLTMDQAPPKQLGYRKLVSSLGTLARLDVGTFVGPLPEYLAGMKIDTPIDRRRLRVLYRQDTMTSRDLFRVGISVMNPLQHNGVTRTEYTIRPTRVLSCLASVVFTHDPPSFLQ